MTKNRIIALMLAALLLTCALLTASCGKKKPSDDTNQRTDDNYPDYLKGKTYNNDTIRLLVATEAHEEYFQEKESKNNVSAAIYNRNLKVMERHKVELEYIPSDGPTVMNTTILAVVQSGDQTYDIFSPSFWWNPGNAGVAYDLSDIDILHFDQPWWYQGWNDALTYLDGSMYYCTGAVNLLTFSGNSVIFLNKTVFGDVTNGYNGATVDDIHQLVLDGGWTKDVLLSYVKLFGGDLDYNNTFDENDAYGHVTTYASITHQLAGWGVTLKFTENNGDYEWSFFTKGFLEKYEEYGKLLKDTHTTTTHDWLSWPNEAFSDDRILFLTTPLNNYNTLQDGNADYTILPLTKYDESQKKYRTMGYGAILTAIPACLDEVERAAVILEALNYESYQSVLPEIKETTLKYKVANDEGTMKMLDLIYDSTVTDFAYVQNEKLKIWNTVMNGTNPNITSAFMSQKEMYNQLLNAVLYDET